jgi:hypothetical protein
MLEKMVSALVAIIISQFPEALVKKAIDSLLDIVEDFVTDTANQLDDAAVLPIIGAIRDYFDLPDNDEPVE